MAGKKSFTNDFCVILECAGLVHDIGNPPFGHSSKKQFKDGFQNVRKHYCKK